MAYQNPTCPAPPHRLVPFVYVADVRTSLEFYGLLGFVTRSTLRDNDGRVNWAWAETPGPRKAQLMFSRTWRPIVPGHQDIFFYVYTLNLRTLRDHLLAHGVQDGGPAHASEPAAGEPPRTRTLFAVHHPPYMPQGEFRLHDPDGYCLLIGQLDEPVHGGAEPLCPPTPTIHP